MMEGEGMIKQEQLNAIKERVAKATMGPWKVAYDTDDRDHVVDIWFNGEDNGHAEIHDNSFGNAPDNARFISRAREDVPTLVAEVEYLRGMLRDTRKIVRQKVKEVKTLQNACKNYKAKHEALVIENEQLSETLCFYGDLSKYVIIAHMNKETDLAVDLGEKARQALGGKAHE
ncbi:hypothetical protein [Lysinibacillus capsici]|uniref:hypothetical protein n=1 Tax=Lysinibacillus capsici TaxID=2115968 RepID=UPI00289B4899|nr:hypothetical protein [Lysinibacillus capsici]